MVPSPNQVTGQFGKSCGKWVDLPNLICVTISKINVESKKTCTMESVHQGHTSYVRSKNKG